MGAPARSSVTFGGRACTPQTDPLRNADRKTCYFIRYETRCSTDRLPLGDADRGAFEEYRYDALGRRILVRTRTDPLCQSRCTHALRRVVWDGDQMLYEISAPGGTGASEAEMERDVGHHQTWHFTQDHFPYGRVVYAHGVDLDHPLSMMRMEYSDSLPGPVLLIPHMNQASAYDTATFSEHRCREYRAPKPQVITLTDPDSAYETKLHCVEVDWPAPYLTATRDKRPLLGSISWMGSLIDEKRDASGQMYMRNRYYDPSTGRFTQEDPIGLAGGLNLYGFANGDPVTYSDPYGLCPKDIQKANGLCPGDITVEEWKAVEATYSHMSEEAADRTHLLLWSGNVRGYSAANAEFGKVTPAEREIVQINRSRVGTTDSPYSGNVFANPEKLAKTLIHEGKHVDQLKNVRQGQVADYMEKNKQTLEAEAYRYERKNYKP